nr:uncharacterized protein LOC111502702 [Leptinotarsa decemlineata]
MDSNPATEIDQTSESQHPNIMGTFKIVQTVEEGQKQLTIVPSSWIHNNQLSWPITGADELIRNPYSMPEASWFTIACQLKRSHLMTYEIAEEELKRMLEMDAEQEEVINSIQPKKQRRLILRRAKPSQNDLNTSPQECLEASLLRPVAKVSEEFPHIVTEVNVPSTSSLDLQVNNKIDKMLQNQDIVIENQQDIIYNLRHSAERETQLKILQKLAKLEVILNSVANSSNNSTSCSCKNANGDASSTNKDDFFFDPIDTLADLEKLEMKLTNKTCMEEYVQKFSYVCGRKGSGNGITNCYILVDKIFSRKFMTFCSWAGGARDGKEKIPFKIFKNIIGLFFRVVNLSDDDFTLKNCEDFFKAVIRNSTKRSESSLARSSRTKRRPTSLTYKAQKETKETKDFSNDPVGKTEIADSHKEGNVGRNINMSDNLDFLPKTSSERVVEEK